VISIKEIQALATMPSKEEIYSKLLFLISAPAQRLVTVMNAVGKDLAVGHQPGRGEEQVQGSLRLCGRGRTERRSFGFNKFCWALGRRERVARDHTCRE